MQEHCSCIGCFFYGFQAYENKMAHLLIYLVILLALERSCVGAMSVEQPRIVKARLGEDVTFTCVSEVNETRISVQWNKLNYSDETTNSRMSINGGHLVIENLQIADAGLYACQAIFGDEGVDPVRLQTISLEVEGLTCTLRSYHASNYGNLTSNCSSNGTVRYHTKCYFECDDSSILIGRSLLTCGTNDTFDFPLPTCRDKNMYAVVNPRTADVGENVVMPCGTSAPAEDAYNVYWYKCDKNKTLLLHKTYDGEITPYLDRGYEVYNGTDLLIPFATKNDSGTYQCIVFSHVKHIQYPHTSYLSVRGSCKMPKVAGALHTNTTTCRSEATIAEGAICHYYCQSNYKLVGHALTKCLENGRLSKQVPSCKEELSGCQTCSTWSIALIVVALLIVGANVIACIIWKRRIEKTGNSLDHNRNGTCSFHALDPSHPDPS